MVHHHGQASSLVAGLLLMDADMQSRLDTFSEQADALRRPYKS